MASAACSGRPEPRGCIGCSAWGRWTPEAPASGTDRCRAQRVPFFLHPSQAFCPVLCLADARPSIAARHFPGLARSSRSSRSSPPPRPRPSRRSWPLRCRHPFHPLHSPSRTNGPTPRNPVAGPRADPSIPATTPEQEQTRKSQPFRASPVAQASVTPARQARQDARTNPSPDIPSPDPGHPDHHATAGANRGLGTNESEHLGPS